MKIIITLLIAGMCLFITGCEKKLSKAEIEKKVQDAIDNDSEIRSHDRKKSYYENKSNKLLDDENSSKYDAQNSFNAYSDAIIDGGRRARKIRKKIEDEHR
jgi:hypothetical protein